MCATNLEETKWQFFRNIVNKQERKPKDDLYEIVMIFAYAENKLLVTDTTL